MEKGVQVVEESDSLSGKYCYFPRDLGLNSYGGDVSCLQQFLSHEVSSRKSFTIFSHLFVAKSDWTFRRNSMSYCETGSQINYFFPGFSCLRSLADRCSGHQILDAYVSMFTSFRSGDNKVLAGPSEVRKRISWSRLGACMGCFIYPLLCRQQGCQRKTWETSCYLSNAFSGAGLF
jgi:hypothetical protein